MTNTERHHQRPKRNGYSIAVFAIIGLLPLGMGARGCDYATVGNDCKTDGGASANAKCASGCLVEGKRYAVGENFKSSDGCNSCGCTANGEVRCTLVACDGGTGCGGLRGAGCAKDQYCDFAPAAQCGAADQTGTCKKRPEGCRDVSEPVCACDDKTYANACEAAVAGTSVASQGACSSSGGGQGTAGNGGGGPVVDAGQGSAGTGGECSSCPGPAPKSVSLKCSDGSIGGPVCSADAKGTCSWTIRACPVPSCPPINCPNMPAPCANGFVYDSNGCATCQCMGAGGGGTGCDYNGQHYNAGDGFPATDGCNKCTCSQGGSIGCTKIACPSGQSCGGIAGIQCKKGEYCNFAPAAQCGAGDQSGTCTTIPQVCDTLYAPVCGCDDKTYPNDCNAGMASVAVAHTGECGSNGGGDCNYNGSSHNAGDSFPSSDGCNTCSCTKDGGIVCTQKACSAQICGGFAGFTCDGDQYCNYPLDAMCGIADGSGTCMMRPQVCTAIYAPVCGCDGNTYSSECVAASSGVGVRAKGACK